jgi:hypothetical protein
VRGTTFAELERTTRLVLIREASAFQAVKTVRVQC